MTATHALIILACDCNLWFPYGTPVLTSLIGHLEVDYDADGWADWDEDVHGPMGTRENQERYPKNFKWTCCGVAGDESGCEDCPHTY